MFAKNSKIERSAEVVEEEAEKITKAITRNIAKKSNYEVCGLTYRNRSKPSLVCGQKAEYLRLPLL